ncbi:MAG: hypothetical protein Q9164_006615 [Protoblastenia rupestris]
MRLFSYSRGDSADLQLWDSDRTVELSANAVAFVQGRLGICETAAGEVSEVADSTRAPSLVMPQTIRKFWGPFQGRATLNFKWPVISQDSVVLVTTSEYVGFTPPNNEHHFIRAVSVTVENISPHGPPSDPNLGVTLIVNIGSNSPLNLVTDITVLEAPPVERDDQQNENIPQTIRKYWGAIQGRANLNYNWGVIDQDSVFLITTSKYNDQRARFIGAASVENIGSYAPY